MKAENSHSIFSSGLRTVRIEKGLSQTGVCKALGLSTSALSSYEQGQRHPTINGLKILADFYNVTTDWLIGRDEYKPTKNDLVIQDPKLNYWYNDLSNASEEDWRKLRQLWEALKEK
ncbi:helix-turn-helix transcriptional regulator [Domibacillus sp. DTU_2020_1001157_1_SI_ALB_TIR_016]|uniref:helix-turn-helix domain-containing protein n=1 Tax=Domibacillus sp. DTU_2020_1001157_1_SI_ALB_TIR_016 TaxID=3077789 RepID=UPI0028EAC157|nr:helix-turn-helix transcriptional regulator [Domibacillus sp. DTU_2020_1001157_1_SI_ALB_TIR_016]WNS79551.1 helix-turn-helix transcriptional regulator [Domibacillus sp. DTU_2020_1001157_1_SI_ALB_TIR_016]